MAVTPAQIQARFPEFADADAGVVQMCLDEAAGEVNRKAWGSRADQGIAFLTAHRLAVLEKGKGAAVGPVQAKSVGKVSVTYGTQSGGFESADAILKSTPYGAEYLRLRSLVFASRVLGGV